MNKYKDYFDINPRYFPCVDDSALRAGVDWTEFFPHETFVKLLEETERVLARQNKNSVWIEGAYGTGKSHAAWTLKNILECPDVELRNYFDQHPQKLRNDLLNKLLGHKAGGKIVVAHRYASSSIRGDRDLIFAVQESIRKALIEAKVAHKGDATLKESVIKWIEKPLNKTHFDNLLKSDDYHHIFHGKDADAVLAQLKSGKDVHDLMENIFKLASQEGITALDIDMDQLVAWLENVIDCNKLKALVLVWDEFSEYFKNNGHSLSEFQKLAAVSQHKPFYLIVVTHESGHLFSDKNPDWKKLRDRFTNPPVEITLPDNIAFDLTAHALVKKDAAKVDWVKKAGDLNSRMVEARKAVAKATNIVDEKVLQDVAPLHPMAALLLKHIAKSFKANQRSMFDFIKNHESNEEVKAFQWFIAHHGPQDEQSLLTIDYLWNFFYERGRDDLTSDIRAVLDVYPRVEKGLDKNEKRVLKTVLMMQSVGQRLDLEIFKPTAKNLDLAFEGTDLEMSPKASSIAQKLVRDEILFDRPLGGGKTMFAAVTVAGGEEVEKTRQMIRDNTKTNTLISEGALADMLSLSPIQKLRWDIVTVSVDDFTRQANILRNKNDMPWKMKAIIGFAKNDVERDALRKLMRDAATNKDYEGVLFIDTSATPLGQARFDEYVDDRANGQYWRGKDNHLADDMDAKGKAVLIEWKNTIYNGQFVLYSALSPTGSVVQTGQQVLSELTNVVLKKFPLALDGLSVREMLSGLVKKSDVEKGIKDTALQTGVAGEKEKQSILNAPSTPKIKEKVEKTIQEAFKKDGRISLADIFEPLLNLGFMPANLHGFLMGFLLKEYATDAYRWSDGNAAETMTSEKLAEAIAEVIKHKITPIRHYSGKFILLMTPEERAFSGLTAKVFGIAEGQCVSFETTARLVCGKMKSLIYPLWTLENMALEDTYPTIADYLELVNPQGKRQSDIALKIGKAALADTHLGDNLKALITKESCRKGMEAFLGVFEGGKAERLAKGIGAELLADVAAKFDSPESLWLWDRTTGEERIRDLILDYEIVVKSNAINAPTKSLRECYAGWRNRLNFVKMPWEALQQEFPACVKILELLRDIAVNGQIIAEKRQAFLDELTVNEPSVKSLFNDSAKHFKSVYRVYLEDLDDGEISAVAGDLEIGMFVREKSEAYQCVMEVVADVKRSQAKTRLRRLWSEKTSSQTPRQWSLTHKTPILCLVPVAEHEETKRSLDTLNRENPTNDEVVVAEAWLDKAAWLKDLQSNAKRDAAFKAKVMGRYAAMLPSVDEVRDLLSKKAAAEPYDWFPSPEVKEKLEAEAKKRYNAGGSNKVVAKIDAMDDATLKVWLKKLVKDNMTVGMEIIGEE